MQLVETGFSGVYLVKSNLLADQRGSFLKLWQEDLFTASLPDTKIREIYTSRSRRGAVRGLHFQIPPHEHDKLIFCLHGKIFDACVDLRRSSATYGKHFTIELTDDSGIGVLVPRGFAHGLQALTEDALIVNALSGVYAPNAERGIAWDSCGIAWPIAEPLLSDKDRAQPRLADFESPFA